MTPAAPSETQSPTPQAASIRYPVLLESVEGGWIASILGMTGYRAVGSTKTEAVDGLKKVLRQQLDALLPLSGEITSITLPAIQADNPWVKMVGCFQDDPLFNEMLEHVDQYRRELDADMETELTGHSEASKGEAFEEQLQAS